MARRRKAQVPCGGDCVGRNCPGQESDDSFQSGGRLRPCGELCSNEERSVDVLDARMVAHGAGNVFDSPGYYRYGDSNQAAGFGILCAYDRDCRSMSGFSCMTENIEVSG